VRGTSACLRAPAREDHLNEQHRPRPGRHPARTRAGRDPRRTGYSEQPDRRPDTSAHERIIGDMSSFSRGRWLGYGHCRWGCSCGLAGGRYPEASTLRWLRRCGTDAAGRCRTDQRRTGPSDHRRRPAGAASGLPGSCGPGPARLHRSGVAKHSAHAEPDCLRPSLG
jgi:hypothetical protein